VAYEMAVAEMPSGASFFEQQAQEEGEH